MGYGRSGKKKLNHNIIIGRALHTHIYAHIRKSKNVGREGKSRIIYKYTERKNECKALYVDMFFTHMHARKNLWPKTFSLDRLAASRETLFQ